MYIDFHLEICVLIQTAELYSPGKYLNWNLNFFQWRAYVSYGEFFKVPCATVHELYRSNLVCTLIPIWKSVFWSKQQICTALGSMWTGIWFYQLWAFIYLAMENFSKWPVRPYTNCTGQVWYVHWFPSWKVCFGPNSRAVQSWQISELEFEFFQWRAYVSYGEFFKVPCATVHELYRSYLVCTLIPIWKGVFWPQYF